MKRSLVARGSQTDSRSSGRAVKQTFVCSLVPALALGWQQWGGAAENAVSVEPAELNATAHSAVASEIYCPPAEVLSAAPTFRAATQARLQQALNASVVQVSFNAIPLRSVLRELQDTYKVALICDCRVDPNRRITLSTGSSLRHLFETISMQTGTEVGQVGEVIYFGPENYVSAAQALAESNRWALVSPGPDSSILPQQRVRLLSTRTIRWPDLTRPSEILDQIAKNYDLTVQGTELVRHDLWAGGVMPEMDACEHLNLILLQQRLTFRWMNGGRGIQLVPLPAEQRDWIAERAYTLATAELARQKQEFPEVKWRPAGKQILATAPLRIHEQLKTQLSAASATPGETKAASTAKSNSSPPLSRRQFTLAISQQPISAVMRKLEESGIEFSFDEAKFKTAGISLETRTTLNITQADASTFLRELFKPLPIDVRFEGTTVYLSQR